MKKASRNVSRLFENVLILLPILIIFGIAVFGFVSQAWAAQSTGQSNRSAYFLQSALPTNTFTPIPVPDTPTPTYTFTPLPVPDTPTPTYTFTPLPVPDTPTPTSTFTPIPVNTPPEIVYFRPVTAPIIEVNESVVFEADVFDPDVNDMFTVVVDWGDGTIDTEPLPEPDPFPVTITHQFDSAGIFTVNLSVLDNAGGVDSQPYEYVVVSDPSSGAFLTGAGRIASPEGAYYPDPTVAGPANFGFNSRANSETGAINCKVQFNLLAADLHYSSQECDWMVISGDRAYLYGQGTINGQGNYTFYLTAVDGSSVLTSGNGRLRLKIWDDLQIVYDNILPGTGLERYQLISEGKIKIHR